MNDSILSEELGLSEFNVLRCDRSVLTSEKCRGGGVLLAIRKYISFTVIPLVDESFECICVKLSFSKSNVIVVLTYIPPISSFVSSVNHYELINCITDSLINSVDNCGVDDKLLILGDFNVPGYDWVKSDNFSMTHGFHKDVEVRTAASYYSNLCSNYSLVQSNTLKNSSNNILDLVFSNISKISVVAALEAIFDCDEHHHALDIEIPNFGYSILDTIEYIYDFKNANFDAISKYIMDSPFFNLSNFGVANIESHSSQFQIFLSNLLNQFVPKFAIKSHRFPKWFSKQLIAAIIRKKKYHKLYKMYNTSFYYNLFKKERTLCNKLIESDDTRYNNGVEEFLAVNSKSFFNFVNTISRNRDLP